MTAAFDDRDRLAAFADMCDVITFEFENLPADTIEYLAGLKPVNPNANALAITQDRFNEKTFVEGLGLKTAPFASVKSEE